jgi:hypothetical protein
MVISIKSVHKSVYYKILSFTAESSQYLVACRRAAFWDMDHCQECRCGRLLPRYNLHLEPRQHLLPRRKSRALPQPPHRLDRKDPLQNICLIKLEIKTATKKGGNIRGDQSTHGIRLTACSGIRLTVCRGIRLTVCSGTARFGKLASSVGAPRGARLIMLFGKYVSTERGLLFRNM